MPNPTKANIHVNRPLTNISIAYIQKAESFVAGQVFPVVKVVKQSDRYFVYLKEDWFRDEAMKRVQGSESAGGGYEIDNTPNYFCETWAYHKDVTEEDRANSDSPLTPDRDAAEFTTQKCLIKREVEWVTRFFATGLWTYQRAGAAAAVAGTSVVYWSTAGSTPIQDVDIAKIGMQSITGFKPNVMVVSPYVHMHLRNHADVLDRIKYTQRGIVTKELLASLFEVDKYLVAEGVKNSAAKGADEDTDFIAGKHCLLAYAAPRPSIKMPTAGYTFAWTGLVGGQALGHRINKIPMDWLGIGTKRIEAEMAFDLKLVAADLGSFFLDVVE